MCVNHGSNQLNQHERHTAHRVDLPANCNFYGCFVLVLLPNLRPRLELADEVAHFQQEKPVALGLQEDLEALGILEFQGSNGRLPCFLRFHWFKVAAQNKVVEQVDGRAVLYLLVCSVSVS